MSPRLADALSVLTLLVATVAGFALAGDLPARMAVHFSASGAPDGFMSRTAALLVVPAVAAAVLVLMRAGPELGIRSEREFALTALATTVGLAYIHGVVLAWNLGVRVSPTLSVLPGIAVVLAGVGYSYYQRSRGLTPAPI